MDLAEEILGISDAKTQLGNRLKKLQAGQLERVVLMRQTTPLAVILSVEDYNRFRELEVLLDDLEDLKAALGAKETDSGKRIDLDELKRKLGLD